MRTGIRRKAFKDRMYPTKAPEQNRFLVLNRGPERYNAAVQERRDAYELMVKRHPSYYDPHTRKELTKAHAIKYSAQQNALPEIKHEIRPEYEEVAAHVLQEVLKRLDQAFQASFRRIREGQTPGYPRFQGQGRSSSFTYPDKAGWKLLDDPTRPPHKKGIVKVRLQLSTSGTVKLQLHRDLLGKMKTLTIKQEADQWDAVFSCQQDKPEPLPVSYEDIGSDRGITHFAALSTGEFSESPKYDRKAEKKINALQQAKDRTMPRSHRRKKAAKALGKASRKVRNPRQDFLHTQSRKLVKRYQIIAREKLQTEHLVQRPKPKQDETTGQYFPNAAAAKAGFNTSMTDARWATFAEMLRVKAAWAGREIVFVHPNYTSHMCPTWGTRRPKTLEERWHSCTCGCELERDTASAKVIFDLGKPTLAGARPTLATV